MIGIALCAPHKAPTPAEAKTATGTLAIKGQAGAIAESAGNGKGGGKPFIRIYSTEAASITDNIKIWNHIVSEDPEWEYNNYEGREDAIHPIYGVESGYKPNLASPNSGVGYYYDPLVK